MNKADGNTVLDLLPIGLQYTLYLSLKLTHPVPRSARKIRTLHAWDPAFRKRGWRVWLLILCVYMAGPRYFGQMLLWVVLWECAWRRLIIKLIDFEQNRLSYTTWMDLIQSVEGFNRTKRLTVLSEKE